MRPDWSKLSGQLRYLAKPAEKYGNYEFEDPIQDFLLHKMTEPDKIELIKLIELFERDQAAIRKWLDDFPITEHRELSLVYFTMCVVRTGCDLGILKSGK